MSHWRRTLITIWITEFIAIAGFAMVLPFMPYYVQELGITDVRQAALWAGVAQSATAVGMAVMSPVWGMLSDRVGRKPMVLRATFAAALLMAAMGFAGNVQQLVLLRLGQGIFTGTIAAATTLVASVVPKEQAGRALGSLQTAIYLGVSLGPLMGGVLADSLGYRQCFLVTGVLLFASGILVALLVREQRAARTPPESAAPRRARFDFGQARALLMTSGAAIVALLAVRVATRAGNIAPNSVLPLFLQSLLPPGARVATIMGLVTATAAVSGAIGSPLIGGWGDRTGHRRALIASALAAALFYLPQGFVHDVWLLTALQVGMGFAVGGTLSTLTALLLRSSPTGREGLIFGLDASINGVGSALGPVAGAGIAAVLGLPAAFVVAAVLMAAGAAIAALWVREERLTIAD